MEIHCARCGALMSCNPAGDCWCKELPHSRMREGNAAALKSSQAGAQHAATLQESTATGCLCRACLQQDLRAQGLLGGSSG